MKKLISILLSAALACGLAACGGASSSGAPASGSAASAASAPQGEAAYTVGICQLMEHEALDSATQGFKDKLEELLPGQVAFNEQNAQGETTNCATIVTKFVTDGVDLIMANGTNAVKAAKEATGEIPVVGTSVTSYEGSGLVDSDDAPGANVTGTSDYNPVTNQIELLKALAPDAQTIGIVYCSGEENSQIQADEAKAALEAEGYAVELYTFAETSEMSTVFTQAASEVDAFYEPTDNLVAANMELVRSVTVPAGKVVICAEGGMVENGGLASYAVDYYSLGQAAAEQAYEILTEGSDPAAMPIQVMSTDQLELVVNEEVAAELGIDTSVLD